MLEQKIEELTNAVLLLTQVMSAVHADKISEFNDAPKAETPAPAPKAEKKPAPTPKVEAPAFEVVTMDELQTLCMTIVREDRSKRDAVKATIAEFGDAKTLKDVPVNDLPALKAKLVAL
jgi:hypothetical protein